MKNQISDQLPIVGWREWVSLPDLGLPAIKAKIDTGARTSALHAFFVERYRLRGQDRVCFHLHPLQRDSETVIVRNALLKDQRMVTDSGGHREMRCVIETTLCIGGVSLPIELTLTNRDNMRFRLLVGRQAINTNFLVNSALSYRQGKRPLRKIDAANNQNTSPTQESGS